MVDSFALTLANVQQMRSNSAMADLNCISKLYYHLKQYTKRLMGQAARAGGFNVKSKYASIFCRIWLDCLTFTLFKLTYFSMSARLLSFQNQNLCALYH